jgi:hypothetical protein
MSASARVTDYCLEKLETESPARRAAIYRDLAELTADEQRAATLLSLARQTDAITREHCQLRLALGDETHFGSRANA